MTDTRVLRYIGYCPACDHSFKVRGGHLVHHGFKRPGWGYIVGDCLGALKTPHELSPDLAKQALYQVESWRTDRAKLLESLENGTATSLGLRYPRKVQGQTIMILVKDECSDYEWQTELTSQKWRVSRELVQIDEEIARLSQLVGSWELKDLTTIEEEKAKAQEQKELREQKRDQARKARLDKAVASYQKRIDSALKSKNSNTLADIWEGAQRKLPDIDPSLSKSDALALLDRASVWEAFGLNGLVASPWSAKDKPEDPALRAMRDRMNRIAGYYDNTSPDLEGLALAWPETLGGESKKGAKTLKDVQAILDRQACPSCPGPKNGPHKLSCPYSGAYVSKLPVTLK